MFKRDKITMTLHKWLIGTILLAGLIDAVAIPSRASSAAELGSHAIGLRRRRPQSAASSPLSASPASGIDQANFDKAVRPQDDLFRAVNGAWLATTEIPADRSDYGVFAVLAERAENDCREIIEHCAAAKDNVPGSECQKVGDLYASFMDEARAEELGIRPIAARLAAVDAIQTKVDLVRTLAELSKIGIAGPLGCYVGIDAKKSDEYILHISQSGLGLPDREYYWDAKFKTKLAAYQTYIERMLSLAKIGSAKQAAVDFVALETRIAKIQWSKVENRDANKTYNKMGLAELAKLVPGFDWPLYFQTIGVKDVKDVVVAQPPYLTAMAEMLDKVPLATWKVWLKFNIVRRYASLLNKELVDADFAFYGTTLRGVPQIRPRWKRGVGGSNGQERAGGLSDPISEPGLDEPGD